MLGSSGAFDDCDVRIRGVRDEVGGGGGAGFLWGRVVVEDENRRIWIRVEFGSAFLRVKWG